MPESNEEVLSTYGIMISGLDEGFTTLANRVNELEAEINRLKEEL